MTATCIRCQRPDQAYACDPCTRPLHRLLVQAAALADETLTTITRQDRLPNRGGAARPDPEPWTSADGALRPTALPVNMHAVEIVDRATNTLTTWARLIGEERGALMPEPGMLHQATRSALHIAAHLDWLRHRPQIAEALDELEDACRDLVRVVDRPADLQLVGACDCGVRLYAKAKATSVTCRACGANVDTASRWDTTWQQAQDRLVTAAEAASLLHIEGLATNRDRARKTIIMWGQRHAISQRGTNPSGQPVYRYGDIADRMASQAA